MTKPNLDNYALAQDKIRAGEWRVDAHTGLVYGVKGKAFARTNTDGYIQIKFRDPNNWRRERAVLAHRVVWEAQHGPLANGLEINHRDGCKTNNAPSNLEPVTHACNVEHARATGLTPTLRGIQQGRAILTEHQVREIYVRAWAGEDQALIAADYGVTRASVSNIKRGWSWTHVTALISPAA